MRRHRGFTLVEMLLVVAVIVLLIGMLLPALGRMRAGARVVVCAATMSQLNEAFMSYVTDNRGRSFAYAGNVGQSSFDNFWMALLEAYSGKVDEFRVCPQASKKSDLVWGTADWAWSGHNHPDGYWIRSGGDYHWGSYGLNGWLYRGWGASWLRLRDPAIQPATIPIFADSSWVDGWPTTTDAPPTDLKSPYGPYSQGGPAPSQLGRFCVDRHSRAINVSKLDGSTTLTTLGGLWNLKWSKDFNPGAFNPGL